VALTNAKAKQELSRRHEELRAAGFSEEEQALLKKIATNFNQTMTRFEMRGFAVPSRTSSLGISAGSGTIATTPAQTALRPMLAGVENARPEELPFSREDLRRSFSTQLNELKASIGERKFKSLTAYLHRLYAPATREQVVAIGAPTGKQVSEKMSSPGAVR